MFLVCILCILCLVWRYNFFPPLKIVVFLLSDYVSTNWYLPVTVADRPKACTVFARSEARIVSSNPTQSMDVWCVYVFILY
jgi:hypothetical protein